ncbi:hypothetical protein GOP47_0020413 [Adiantum capillus-veneris]|uniref:DUF4408 domain-containing protein n=1 Tax=Adiantum capillus-veneris TaxID=13818 RepID=A0A9D4UDX0_ADICA|nr:hypothetical protein GOP47_0020413 [Adiantum capillus-veneris]
MHIRIPLVSFLLVAIARASSSLSLYRAVPSTSTSMAASKPQILTFHGTFYLPMVSLAMLAGLVFSFTLPVALSFFISAMDSSLFSLLPQLWNAFLSWITPPCLFVLLNGIIFVLTASSGMLSSSASSSGSSDFCTNLLGKMESSPKRSSRALMEDLSASTSCTIVSTKMQKQHFQALTVDVVPALSNHKPCAVFDAHGTRQAEEGKFYDAEDEEELEEQQEEDSSKFSKLATGMRSFSFSCAENRINEPEESDDDINYGDAWPSYGQSKRSLSTKKMSFFCREEGDCVQMMARSVPTSPQLATQPTANSIKRSLSVDSASFHGKQVSSVPPAENLSDEAFRKRVEDFISKMNAQLRNEVK